MEAGRKLAWELATCHIQSIKDWLSVLTEISVWGGPLCSLPADVDTCSNQPMELLRHCGLLMTFDFLGGHSSTPPPPPVSYSLYLIFQLECCH